MSDAIDLAVIGGSGFYEMPGLADVREVTIATPFGPPSDAIRVGRLEGRTVAFLARHGRGHGLLPSEIPQRANFWALKSLGVTRVLAVSAVGSLREDYRPGDLVMADQTIDRTSGARASTFFGEGVIAHVGMAEPICRVLSHAAASAASAADVPVHGAGTYICIEGPAFGTRAESHLYRAWGADIVGMTAVPEAKLAREAELCYALAAAVTDYDSWHASEGAVDAQTVFAVLAENVERGRATVRNLLSMLPERRGCGCANTLDAALVTPPGSIPPAARGRLEPILRRCLGAKP